ncbi:MAG: RNB domain-containing ribonuclease [Candidatus Kariarchaeaceae archaeon]
MAKKGELVEFKPGLFGIEIPENYGIFIRSFKKKNSKSRFIELFTTKGTKETKQTNVFKKSLGEVIQLKGHNLPPAKEFSQELKAMILRVKSKTLAMQKVDETLGKLSERDLWKKLLKSKFYEVNKGFSVEELAFIWYGIEIQEISRNRIKKVREILDGSKTYGKGYFDFSSGKKPTWIPITEVQQKEVGMVISQLGGLRNKMFHMIEVSVEDSEDPEETEIIRAPLPWLDIAFTTEEKDLIQKLQEIMRYFVENDSWPATGMGNTHIFELDGFSQRSFISYLAQDWINEGKTSYADSFVKMLIRSSYWNDTEALQVISKRIIKLAPHFEWVTDERIEKIAKKFTEPKDTPGSFDGRRDLQHMEFYTIDPPTAKDFDDAICIETNGDGYILWVAIADVAHYVEKDTSLDLHARGRATSVYLPTKTIPMLPTHLSDNLCSLNAQLPRLAMTAEIHYDNKGNKLLNKCKIHNSVIIVKENLSYDYVNQAINDQQSPFLEYFEFAQLLQKHRKGLKLETDDVRLELGGQMSVSIKSSSNSTKMIETFMVAANETVAEILQEKEIPVVFRNHPLPDGENVERFNAQAKVIGLDYSIVLPKFTEEKEESIMDIISSGNAGSITGSISFTIGGDTDFAKQLESQLTPDGEEKDEDTGTLITKGLAQLTSDQQEMILMPFIKILERIEKLDDDQDKQKLAYLIVLRSLSRALYAAGNFGHFGLGSSSYLHFTSPIRRYPDIIAHRVCKAMITGDELVYSAEEIDEIAQHCTEQSEIAEKLERTVIGVGFSFLTRNPEYSENKQGIVASIAKGGVFVLLPNGIEARIPLSRMTARSVFVDEYGSMAFVGFQSTDHIAEEVTPDNWQELLEGEEEPVEIIVKLGDKIAVEFTSWDHIEGRVGAAPISTEVTDL